MAREGIKRHFAEHMKPNGATDDTLQEALHVFPVIMRRKLDAQVISVEQWWETEIDVRATSFDSSEHIYPIEEDIMVQFVGKADALSLHNGNLFIEEHKFVSAQGFGERRREQYQRARQTKGYVYLANANLKGKKVHGVLHNFFLKKKQPELQQNISYIGPKDLKRFECSVCEVAREVYNAQQSGVWRESLDECHGGYSACPFNVLCDFDDNEEVRRQNFTKYESKAKFETLDGSKQSGAAEDISEKTSKLRRGVET